MKIAQKNVTFSLPPETIEQVRELASQYNCSMNTVVKDALDAWFMTQEQAAFEQAMNDAAADPLFCADMASVADDFAALDAETFSSQKQGDATRSRKMAKPSRKEKR